MGKRIKDLPTERFQIDEYHRQVSLRPLIGLKRLVRIERSNWKGVLLCDGVTTVVDSVTFSRSNVHVTPFEMRYLVLAQGFLGEPRLNVPNQASAEQIRRFRDDGKEFVFCFKPERGKTYSVEQDIYRPLETCNGTVQADVGSDRRVETCSLSLDLSAYVNAGCSVRAPMCEFETSAAPDGRRGTPKLVTRRLDPWKHSEGTWQWRVKKVGGALIRVAWAVDNRALARPLSAVNLDRLATELRVDPRVAKDLHNFVNLCHYYVADFRSLNAIHRKMVAARSTLTRSIESIEHLIGAELIERTKGKGLIKVTPAGEAVLEWWSRFYMRWTPISADLVGSE